MEYLRIEGVPHIWGVPQQKQYKAIISKVVAERDNY